MKQPLPRPQQFGERSVAAAEALRRGLAAAAELDLSAALRPVVDEAPDTWMCTLDGPGQIGGVGRGLGSGDREQAQAAAVHEALQRHLSGADRLGDGEIYLQDSRLIATGPLAADPVVALLAQASPTLLACVSYFALPWGNEVEVPVFLSMPDYLDEHQRVRRADLGDGHDYTTVRPYAVGSGWACGSTVADASVHALNEIVERDALQLLLAQQFLTRNPPPLRVVTPTTLPPRLAALMDAARARTGRAVDLIDMTCDTGIPTCLAQPHHVPGAPPLRGCGASLSREYAIERALTELIQRAAAQQPSPLQPGGRRTVPPAAAPPRDLTRALRTAAVRIPYVPSTAPRSPGGHLAHLIDALGHAGYTVHRRTHHLTTNVAVVNLLVPGLDRGTPDPGASLPLPGSRSRLLLKGQESFHRSAV